MTWHNLQTTNELEQLTVASHGKPQLVFKHSTRCSISATAKGRLDRALNDFEGKADLHYLDLLAYRPISNQVAQQFAVHHESPQALLIVNGECIAEWSHLEITPPEILAQLALATAPAAK
jgi:bacillithiol system protein YtxJ